MTADDFWSNSFHWCALAAGFIAVAEGRLEDSRYVQRLAYEMYEEGAFRERVKPQSADSPTPSPSVPSTP